MSKVLIALALVGLVIGTITAAVPWPDITPMTTALSTVIQYTFTYNTVFPIDTLWSLTLIVLGIESGLFTYRLVAKIVSFITGHQAPSDGGVGSGGIGGSGFLTMGKRK